MAVEAWRTAALLAHTFRRLPVDQLKKEAAAAAAAAAAEREAAGAAASSDIALWTVSAWQLPWLAMGTQSQATTDLFE